MVVHTDLLWLKTVELFIPNLEQEDVSQRLIVKEDLYTFSSGLLCLQHTEKVSNMANLTLPMDVQKLKTFQLLIAFP